jgi:hypothetical protein
MDSHGRGDGDETNQLRSRMSCEVVARTAAWKEKKKEAAIEHRWRWNLGSLDGSGKGKKDLTAPAGGWIVSVTCMKKTESATLKPAGWQKSDPVQRWSPTIYARVSSKARETHGPVVTIVQAHTESFSDPHADNGAADISDQDVLRLGEGSGRSGIEKNGDGSKTAQGKETPGSDSNQPPKEAKPSC